VVSTAVRGILAVALGLLAACGDGDATRLRAIGDELCACRDPACIEHARGELADLEKDVLSRYGGASAVPEDLVRMGKDAAACEAKAWTAIDGDDPDLVRMSKARDLVCACTDAPCLGRAQGELDALAAALDARFPAKGSPPPPMMALGAEIGRCIATAVAGAPTGNNR
jgi:hypothetical protein